MVSDRIGDRYCPSTIEPYHTPDLSLAAHCRLRLCHMAVAASQMRKGWGPNSSLLAHTVRVRISSLVPLVKGECAMAVRYRQAKRSWKHWQLSQGQRSNMLSRPPQSLGFGYTCKPVGPPSFSVFEKGQEPEEASPTLQLPQFTCTLRRPPRVVLL